MTIQNITEEDIWNNIFYRYKMFDASCFLSHYNTHVLAHSKSDLVDYFMTDTAQYSSTPQHLSETMEFLFSRGGLQLFSFARP